MSMTMLDWNDDKNNKLANDSNSRPASKISTWNLALGRILFFAKPAASQLISASGFTLSQQQTTTNTCLQSYGEATGAAAATGLQ